MKASAKMSKNSYKPINNRQNIIKMLLSECYVLSITASLLISILSILSGVAYSFESTAGLTGCICFILCICFTQGIFTVMHFRSSVKSHYPNTFDAVEEMQKQEPTNYADNEFTTQL